MVDPRQGTTVGDEDADGDGGADVDWRAIMKELQAGREIALPTTSERDQAKKTRLLTRRAERRGIALDVTPGDGVLRAHKSGDVPIPQATSPTGADAERRERRRAERAGGAS